MTVEGHKSFPSILVKQPIGEFYISSIPFKDLVEISHVDIRRLVGEKGFETYLGIQRPRSKKRIKEIAEYIGTDDACFPSGVIIAVDGRCANYDDATRSLTLKPYIDDQDSANNIEAQAIAHILDGQHRIEGLIESKFDGDFEINVSVFIDIDVAEQAYLFSTINLSQTKVNKSLAYDLFDLAKTRSPQKVCHTIAVALDQTKNSPFLHRIKRLGVATEGRFNETLTQATVVESLLRYITSNPIRDRSIYLQGKVPVLLDANSLNKFIFGNMMIEEKDLEISDIIWNYFDAIRERWPIAWDDMSRGAMLNKTNGFRAFMRFLRPLYLHISSPGEVPQQSDFAKIISKININDADFDVERYKPGTSGESRLFNELLGISDLR